VYGVQGGKKGTEIAAGKRRKRETPKGGRVFPISVFYCGEGGGKKLNFHGEFSRRQKSGILKVKSSKEGKRGVIISQGGVAAFTGHKNVGWVV